MVDITTICLQPNWIPLTIGLFVGFLVGKFVKRKKKKIKLPNQILSLEIANKLMSEANAEINKVYGFLKGIEKEL